VGLLCIADDWFFRPRRQIAASPQEAHDPLPVSVAYHTLPILIGAAVLRMLVSDGLDFSAVLFGITLLTGLLGGTEQFDEFDVRLLRFDHPDAPTNEQATAHLRITAKDTDERKVGRAFSNAATELALAGYAGFHTTAPPGGASAFGEEGSSENSAPRSCSTNPMPRTAMPAPKAS